MTASRATDTVAAWCQLSLEVNTWLQPVSAHQASQSLCECLCAQKAPWRHNHVRHSTAYYPGLRVTGVVEGGVGAQKGDGEFEMEKQIGRLRRGVKDVCV